MGVFVIHGIVAAVALLGMHAAPKATTAACAGAVQSSSTPATELNGGAVEIDEVGVEGVRPKVVQDSELKMDDPPTPPEIQPSRPVAHAIRGI